MKQSADLADLGAVAERFTDHLAGIGQAARTVIAYRESMTEELRTEVLGLLYDRAFEGHRLLAALELRCSRNLPTRGEMLTSGV